MLERVEYMHTMNFIHRDIKPKNFTIGLGKNSKTVSLPLHGMVCITKVMILHVPPLIGLHYWLWAIQELHWLQNTWSHCILWKFISLWHSSVFQHQCTLRDSAIVGATWHLICKLAQYIIGNLEKYLSVSSVQVMYFSQH